MLSDITKILYFLLKKSAAVQHFNLTAAPHVYIVFLTALIRHHRQGMNGKIVLQEIFHLLKRTNKFIVCEGVETKDMVNFLVAEGCDELQGYYYYKPMEMAKFEQLIG